MFAYTPVSSWGFQPGCCVYASSYPSYWGNKETWNSSMLPPLSNFLKRRRRRETF
jgi:hypothetical protein